MIIIKPHHFMDIIKLYGSGIEVFVPDEKMQHDFYKIANEIIKNHQVKLSLTIDADDICQPCVQCINGICDNGLPKTLGNIKKDDYNKRLDQRLIDYLHLDLKEQYTALALCRIMYEKKDIILKVWLEEDDKITQRRFELFQLGAKKYLKEQ
ncbi:MAG: hypothetical protein UFX20_06220 [Longibaculum muris]|uniref:DUF1284 domain-containing protein n=1 Tax=Longibaculum muris TaxID=1796628 RepID=UPI002E7A340B|nr:DUF1284 domain-containing protein [Longibaculum muris]MED9811673.1 hypothetical protein [Longibaculum muris]